MAEAIILPLANSILNTIASFTGDRLTDEIKGFKSVKADVKAIAEDLESIMSVLHDAEAKQYTNASMKIWLKDLKSVVYDIDDLFDEVATDAKRRCLNKGHLLPRLGYYLSLKPVILRTDLSHKMKHLRLQLDRIVAKKTKFGLTDRLIEAPSVERDVFDACGYVDKLAILGRDEAKDDIISRVLSLGDKSSLSVLPVVGMGGIGKTALAKLVYNDIDEFDMKLWVCVSDKFDVQKVLQDILQDATRENTSNYSLRTSVERLRDVLNNQKFFLVLDDLWEDDMKLWLEFKSILAVGGKGSVVLITSRLEKVASNTQTVEPYYLDKLLDSECWCIFKNLAFADGEEERHPRLCEIGLSIVEKCYGIPLVVQCLGSLLRSERDEAAWLRIKNMDNLSNLDGRYDTVQQLLKLSYDKLPFHLKSCFAHLSLFAKDLLNDPYYHLYCWSALGLLQLPDGSYQKNNFFNELISRSMLQDVDRCFDKSILTFKIHDLLHDLAGDILGEELAVLTMNTISVPDSSRYISWESNALSNEEFPKEIKAKKARALIFRIQLRSVSLSFLKGIVSSMPCLRVLVLGSSQLEELPSSIRNLKHLRFLCLSNNCLIKYLPDSLCELLNLECLLLVGCTQLEELPSDMYKLTSLRFLSVTTRQTSLANTKFNRLPSLRHLWLASCEELVSLWDGDDVGCLTSLRSLRVVDCPKLSSLPNSMKFLAELEELGISNCDDFDLERGEGTSGLQSLHTLVLEGVPRLSRLPNGLCSAANSLKYLGIINCEGFTELPNWLQSCASLQWLSFTNCLNLSSLPKEICLIKSLQYLQISSCPHILRRCTVPDGEYLSLIRHVPEIWFDDCRFTPSLH